MIDDDDDEAYLGGVVYPHQMVQAKILTMGLQTLKRGNHHGKSAKDEHFSMSRPHAVCLLWTLRMTRLDDASGESGERRSKVCFQKGRSSLNRAECFWWEHASIQAQYP
jgi:hypothetical protein